MKWVNNQRVKKKQGRIKEEHFNLLNEINFTWNPQETEWNKKYAHFVDFIRNGGDISKNQKSSRSRYLGKNTEKEK